MEMCAGIRLSRPGSSMPSPFSGAICRTQPKLRICSANVRQFWRGMRISYRSGSNPLNQPIPEEVIGEPVGITLAEREIGNNPRCFACEAKGAVLCRTCSGSGLYIDSVLESQGILVKVVEVLEISCVQSVEGEATFDWKRGKNLQLPANYALDGGTRA
ncbi:hypothetical protein EJ110_NYTH36884 [Nymphaea thermarum]|nr:hypothetical protein EJ110_NYTH36884 [Nymphaea thermarum]